MMKLAPFIVCAALMGINSPAVGGENEAGSQEAQTAPTQANINTQLCPELLKYNRRSIQSPYRFIVDTRSNKSSTGKKAKKNKYMSLKQILKLDQEDAQTILTHNLERTNLLSFLNDYNALLRYAVRRNQLHLAALAVVAGADVNHAAPPGFIGHSGTAIEIAAQRPYEYEPKILRLLFNNLGADANARYNERYPTLIRLVARSLSEPSEGCFSDCRYIFQFLLQQGGRVTKEKYFDSLLSDIMKIDKVHHEWYHHDRHRYFVGDILKYAKGLTVADLDGDLHSAGPLTYAAYRGWSEVVKLMLEKGADPNKKALGVHNVTPLFAALIARHYDVDTVQALLDHGADPTMTFEWVDLPQAPIHRQHTKISQLRGWLGDKSENPIGVLKNSNEWTARRVSAWSEIQNQRKPFVHRENFLKIYKLLEASSMSSASVTPKLKKGDAK